MTTRPEVAAALKNKHHFNTFGHNPIAMTQGLATLEVIDEEQLQQNAREVGGYLKNLLLELQRKHALIGEVRGLGLMLGVELVADRATKEPAVAQTHGWWSWRGSGSCSWARGGFWGMYCGSSRRCA